MRKIQTPKFKALILAAGFGKRLNPLTLQTPKALVQVKGVPVLEHVILRINALKPQMILINSHHRAQQIDHFLTQRRLPNCQLLYEPEILDTGGALLNARSELAPSKTLVHNVDILTSFNLNELCALEFEANQIAWLLTRSKYENSGLVVDENSELVGFFDSDTSALSTSKTKKCGFCGIHWIGPKFWQFTSQYALKPISIIDIYKQALKKGLRIKTLALGSADFIDIGSLENLKQANLN